MLIGIMSLSGCDMVRQMTDKELVEKALKFDFSFSDVADEILSGTSFPGHISFSARDFDTADNDEDGGWLFENGLGRGVNFSFDFFDAKTDGSSSLSFKAKLDGVTFILSVSEDEIRFCVPEASEDYLSLSKEDLTKLAETLGIDLSSYESVIPEITDTEIKDPEPFRVKESDLKGSDCELELFGDKINVRMVEMSLDPYIAYLSKALSPIFGDILGIEPDEDIETGGNIVMYFEKNDMVKIIVNFDETRDSRFVLGKRDKDLSLEAVSDSGSELSFSLIDGEIKGYLKTDTGSDYYDYDLISSFAGSVSDDRIFISVSSNRTAEAEYDEDGLPAEPNPVHILDFELIKTEGKTECALTLDPTGGLFRGTIGASADSGEGSEPEFSGSPIGFSNILDTLRFTSWLSKVKDTIETKSPLLALILDSLSSPEGEKEYSDGNIFPEDGAGNAEDDEDTAIVTEEPLTEVPDETETDYGDIPMTPDDEGFDEYYSYGNFPGGLDDDGRGPDETI